MSDFFAGQFFAGEFFESQPTPPTPPAPVIPAETTYGAGGGTYGRRFKPWQTKEEERRERIALGILQADIEDAEAAVVQAGAITQMQAIESPVAAQRTQDALEVYEDVYREFLTAQAIIEQWKHDLAEYRAHINRAAAALLLLH